MDIIAALVTPPGTSALAVIRISGPKLKELMGFFLGKNLKPRMMQRALFKDSQGQALDDVLAVYFPNPQSYTGEDLIEIFPHGNMVLVRKILHELYQFPGLRAAEPGEFTRRAFENGKIDLIQAEAVGQLIHSTNEASLANAQRLLSGELSSSVHHLTEEIKWLSAKMELDVDFSEEEADPDYDSWLVDLNSIYGKLAELYDSWQRHAKLQGTPRVALCGKPNAGKSSLINALVKEDRLLVSAQAGTTRDWVEVPLFLDGGEILLVDTAGFGEAVDELDALSQARSKEKIKQADLVIWIEDGTRPSTDLKLEVDLVIRTKADTENAFANDKILVSSKTSQGIPELKTLLSDKLILKAEALTEAWMGTERQAQGIRLAMDYIQNAMDAIHTQMGVEVLAFELREARSAVEEITGAISTDQILHKIFDGFCIGK